MFDVNELKNKVLDGYKVTKEDAMNLIDVEQGVGWLQSH